MKNRGARFGKCHRRHAADHHGLHGGRPVLSKMFVFNQIAVIEFSVRGAVGANEPAVYQVSGGIAGYSKSRKNVLGPVDFDFTTKFNSSALIEIFFPTKVSNVGFWLNPSLGNVFLIAANTNFAFGGETETILETGTVTARKSHQDRHATADISGFKNRSARSQWVHDRRTHFRRRSSTTVPEPATVLFVGAGLVLSLVRRVFCAKPMPQQNTSLVGEIRGKERDKCQTTLLG